MLRNHTCFTVRRVEDGGGGCPRRSANVVQIDQMSGQQLSSCTEERCRGRPSIAQATLGVGAMEALGRQRQVPIRRCDGEGEGAASRSREVQRAEQGAQRERAGDDGSRGGRGVVER